MKLIKKWRKTKEKQREKDIEDCRQHPIGWKIMIGAYAIGFASLIVFMVFSGAYLLAAIAFIFAIWFEREYFRIYRKAFPKNVIL